MPKQTQRNDEEEEAGEGGGEEEEEEEEEEVMTSRDNKVSIQRSWGQTALIRGYGLSMEKAALYCSRLSNNKQST